MNEYFEKLRKFSNDYMIVGELEILGVKTKVNYFECQTCSQLVLHTNSGDSILAKLKGRKIYKLSRNGRKFETGDELPLKLKKIVRKPEKRREPDIDALTAMKLAFHVR